MQELSPEYSNLRPLEGGFQKWNEWPTFVCLNKIKETKDFQLKNKEKFTFEVNVYFFKIVQNVQCFKHAILSI